MCAMLGSGGLHVITIGVVLVRIMALSLSVSARNVRGPLRKVLS